jgi:sulfatase maturation enzyme AslB (radical SAM superfamily)
MDNLQKAISLKEQNKNAEAITVFTEILQAEPQNMQIAEEIARLYEKEGNSLKSAEYFELCLQNNHNTSEISKKLSQINFDNGLKEAAELKKTDILGAIELFSKLLKAYPQKSALAEELGILHDAVRNFDESEYFYNICLKNNHNTDEILFRLAATNNVLNNFDKAREYFLLIENKRKYLSTDFLYAVIRLIEHFTANSQRTTARELIEAVYKNADFTGITKRAANALLNSTEILLEKTELQSYPKSLLIDPTGKCNFACIMCDKKSTGHEISESQKEEIKELLEYASFVVWAGGEPFLYPHIMELLQAAYEAGTEQIIFTNGSLLTEKIIENLALWNVKLAVSIDAPDKETYEKIRRGGKFEVLIKTLELIKKYKNTHPDFITELHFVIQKENYKLLEQTLDFAAKYNFTKVVFTPNYIKTDDTLTEYLKSGNAALYQKAHKLGVELQHWLAEHSFGAQAQQSSAKAQLPKILPQADNCFINALKNEIEKLVNVKHATPNKQLPCTLPWTSFFLMSLLETNPSCYCTVFEKDWQKYTTLKQMWNSPVFRAYRQAMLNADSDLCSTGCKTNLIPDSNKKR